MKRQIWFVWLCIFFMLGIGFVKAPEPFDFIILPQNYQIFNTNINLPLNYTIDGINFTIYCWYNITTGNASSCTVNDYNSSTDILIPECQNTTFNITGDDGWYSITLVANNSLDERICNYRNFAIDTTSPNITIQQPIGYYNYSTGLLLNYTIEDAIAGVDIKTCRFSVVYKNGTVIIDNQSLTNCANSTFDVSFDGQYNLTIWANDTVGNVGNSTINFTIDTTKPYLINVTILGGYYNGTDYFFSPANQDNLYDSITFNAKANEVVNWDTQHVWNSSNTKVKYFGKVDNNISITKGPWDLNLTLTTDDWATDGYYFINVTITDLAGNSNSTEILHFYVDNTPPVINLISPANNTWSNKSSNDLIFSFSDTFFPTANCSLYINGTLNQTNESALNNTETTFSVNLVDGTYTWGITCKDLVANENSSETRIINIDTIAPQIAFITPTPDNGYKQTEKSFVINVSHNESNPDRISIYLNSTLVWEGSYNGSNGFTNWTFTNLTDGVYSYYVCVNDGAGNQNCTETRNITIYTASQGGGGGTSGSSWFGGGGGGSIQSICQSNWTCTVWSECVNGTQTRTCIDANECKIPTTDRPTEIQNCTEPVKVWTCEPSETTCCELGKIRCINGILEQCSNYTWQFFHSCASGRCADERSCESQIGGFTGQAILGNPSFLSLIAAILGLSILTTLLILRRKRKITTYYP
ncbi:MAG: hypothetical protein QW703_01620 [Candidatus Aenigmatarchaeota archaeon]